MYLTVLALGTRMPPWVQRAVDDYGKRLPPEIKLRWRELPLAGRRGAPRAEARAAAAVREAKAREAAAVRKALREDERLVVLDVGGRALSSEQLARQLGCWQRSGRNSSLLIGGPDGVDDSLLPRAEWRWSLSPLTLPHALVRVLLAEQIYRAWSINAGHPYHRS